MPATYSYHCAATSTVRSTDSTGWIPINFGTVAIGSSLSQLPIDPINQSSSRLYYTYTTNGTQFEVTSAMESAKYKLGGSNDVISGDGSTLSTVYAKGSNVNIEPLDYGDNSLIGYWPLTEGTGTIAYDDSGNNATGTWYGTAPYYSTASKIGSYSGIFASTTGNYLVVPVNLNNLNNITAALWYNPSSANLSGGGVGRVSLFSNDNGGWGNNIYMQSYNWLISSSNYGAMSPSLSAKTVGTWYSVVVVWNQAASLISLYVNGSLLASGSGGSLPSNNRVSTYIGEGPNDGIQSIFPGLIQDVRIYNRALSASEIAAMYSGGK